MMNDLTSYTKVPLSIKIASSVWILYGVLIALNAIVPMVFMIKNKAVSSEEHPYEVYISWAGIFVIFVLAYVFLHIGIKTIKGKAKDTLGSGIGSVGMSVFGLYSLLQLFEFIDVFALIPQVLLFIAGLLALIGRAKYKDFVNNKNT